MLTSMRNPYSRSWVSRENTHWVKKSWKISIFTLFSLTSLRYRNSVIKNEASIMGENWPSGVAQTSMVESSSTPTTGQNLCGVQGSIEGGVTDVDSGVWITSSMAPKVPASGVDDVPMRPDKMTNVSAWTKWRCSGGA